MPISEEAISLTAAALASIDADGAARHAEEVAAEIQRLDAAIVEADASLTELADRLQKLERVGPDEYRLSEALLTGGDPLAAADSKPILEGRRAAIIAGMKGLRTRRDAQLARKDHSRDEARRAIGEALTPIADALEAEAVALHRALADLYADVYAAAACGGNGRLRALREALEQPMARLAEGSAIFGRPPLAVSEELRRATAPGAAALEAARCGLPEAIRFPAAKPDANPYLAHIGSLSLAEQARGAGAA